MNASRPANLQNPMRPPVRGGHVALTAFAVFASATSMLLFAVPGCALSDGNLVGGVSRHSLYHRIGGRPKIEVLVGAFLDRLRSDPQLNYVRAGTPRHWRPDHEEMQRIQDSYVRFFCVALGGTEVYEGPSLQIVHDRMGITGEDFKRAIEHLEDALDACRVPEPERQAIVELFSGFKGSVAKGQEAATQPAGTGSPSTGKGAPTSRDAKWFELGQTSAQEIDACIAHARSAGSVARNCYEAYCQRMYLILGGDFEQASQVINLQAAISGPKGKPMAVMKRAPARARAIALIHVGRRDEALDLLVKGIPEKETWSDDPSGADPDDWAAACLRGWVSAERFTAFWRDHPQHGSTFACWAWFWVGQGMEAEGNRNGSIAAYGKSVELGGLPDAHYIHNWSAYRLKALTGRWPTGYPTSTSAPATTRRSRSVAP